MDLLPCFLLLFPFPFPSPYEAAAAEGREAGGGGGGEDGSDGAWPPPLPAVLLVDRPPWDRYVVPGHG